MKKIFLLFSVIIAFLLIISTLAALLEIPANENAMENSDSYNSNVIEASDSGWFLKHIYIIHYAKPDATGKPAKPSTSTCYKTFSKWITTPVSFTISTAITDELTAEEMMSAISTSAETWDASTSRELFNDAYSVIYALPFGANDGTNALMFGEYSNTGVIAVTSIWYSRGKLGRIYDSDILFNTHFTWGTTGNSSVMDLQNIATHELGHFIGLSDIYQSSCSSVTMYGYSTEGDIAKRTLEQPDITGLQKLYGL